MEITNPTAWWYLFRLGACGLCRLNSDCSHAVGLAPLCSWKDVGLQGGPAGTGWWWPHSRWVLPWTLLGAERMLRGCGSARRSSSEQCHLSDQRVGSPTPIASGSLPEMGSARNNNYLVIRKGQRAMAFCEITLYSPRVFLGVLCKICLKWRW